MSHSKIKVGVAGFGVSARVFHLPFIKLLSDKYELRSVLQRRGDEAAAQYPSVVIARDMDSLAADPDLELIIITSSNDTHYPFARQALEAGKHVVVEKPFTNTTEEAGQLIQLARRSGKILSVYQNRRYVSDFRTIREILDKKLLGDIHEFEAHFDRYRPEARPNAWREAPLPGSGILYDLGAHLIDQALCLFGLPLSITADIRCQRPHARADDYFNLWLNYAYTKVILHAGMLVRESGPRYMIQGTSGSFIKYGDDPQEARLKAGEPPVGKDWGQEPASSFGLLHTATNGTIIREKYPSLKGSYADYYEDLYQTIVHQQPLKVKPEQGYNVIRTIELAVQSNLEMKMIECTGLIDVNLQ